MQSVPVVTPSAKPRTLLQRLLDALTTRLLRLPPETCSYSVTRDLAIPMRDGVELLADIYTPAGAVLGTLLLRSPYGWNLPMATLSAGVYCTRGYRVILARCRGTFGSGGVFEPMVNEVRDGADTVAWMRQQPWFDGRFATFGGSYLGFTQWALLMDPPPELVTAVISMGPHDFHDCVYQGGAFNLLDFLRWAAQVAHQEQPFWKFMRHMLRADRRLASATRELPLVDVGQELLDGRSTWYRDWVSTRDAADPMWASMKLGAALERVQVPILLQAGWQDLFLQQSLLQFEVLSRRGLDVGLTIGPWTHSEIVTTGGPLVVRETLDWLAEHLAGTGIRARFAPARVFVTGAANQWRDLPTWPPATGIHVLYPRADGSLAADPASAGTAAGFTWDPADPTPTVGGRILQGGGYVEDGALARRHDLLVYTSSVLATPLEIHGNPVLEVQHSTDNPHADLYARISEVDPQGRSRNVSEAFLRLDPTCASGSLQLTLNAVAHRFAAGSRIRLQIAGGSHPHWERNLGTGEHPATTTRMLPSRRTIELSASRLQLPVGR